MQPVLFSAFGMDVQSYGVSKVLAAVVAALLLGRFFAQQGLSKDDAYHLVFWATVWGFVGGKIYFLLEHTSAITWHHLSGSGFTWYGGLVGGAVSFGIIIKRRHLPATAVIDAAAIPLALAYGIGRMGCWLSGDGTYGKPTALPWGQAFPHGAVPVDTPVHPTPLYEALAAVVIAAILWRLRRTRRPALELFGSYLVLSGVSQFAVEFLRINDAVVGSLTQPQLWALASVATGGAIIVMGHVRARRQAVPSSDVHANADADGDAAASPGSPAH